MIFNEFNEFLLLCRLLANWKLVLIQVPCNMALSTLEVKWKWDNLSYIGPWELAFLSAITWWFANNLWVEESLSSEAPLFWHIWKAYFQQQGAFLAPAYFKTSEVHVAMLVQLYFSTRVLRGIDMGVVFCDGIYSNTKCRCSGIPLPSLSLYTVRDSVFNST